MIAPQSGHAGASVLMNAIFWTPLPGGEAITLAPAEAAAYLKDVTSVIPPVMDANAQLKMDYETMLAAAKKLH